MILPSSVLITGGAGFIGQHLVRNLVGRGLRVRVLDSLREDVHHGVAPALPDGVELVIGDVRDRDAVAAALDGVEAVAHLAAKVGLGVDVQDLPDYADTNMRGTAVVLAAMATAGIGRLALASSMVVYGEGLARCAEHGLVSPAARRESDLSGGQFEPPCPICGEPVAPALVDEDGPMDPRNAYAVSKLSQEQLATTWARSTGGMASFLRYHNVYGPGMPRDTPYAGVASIFLSALARGEAPRVYEDGGQRRDFIHVRDVAAATAAGLLRAEPGDSSAAVRAYNAGSGTVRTVGEMAQALARAVDGPAPEVTGQYRLGDVRHITADSSRLMRELGWAPAEDFERGMAELAGGPAQGDVDHQ